MKNKHKMTVISHHLGHGVKISTQKVVRGCGFDHCGVHFYVVLLNCVSLGPRLQTKETKKGLRKVHRAIKESGYFRVANFTVAQEIKIVGSWLSKQCEISLQM